MKTLGRRGVLKLLGVGAAGAAAAPAALPAAIGPTSLGVFGAAFGPELKLREPGQAVWHWDPPAPSDPTLVALQAAARKLCRDSYADHELRRSWRIQGFDHDIYGLVSVPLATKVRMQRERDQKPLTLLEEMRRAAWPESNS